MRKLSWKMVTALLLLLHFMVVPVRAAEDMNIMAEFISGGHLVNGEDYADQNPYMGYTITNVKKDEATIGNDEISTDFSVYYDGMMGYGEELPIPEYSFTIELAEGHSLLQQDGVEGNVFYAGKTLESGEYVSGELTLEPETQSVTGRFSPSSGHDLFINFLINATYRYTFQYDYWSEASQSLVNKTEEGTISLNFDQYVTYWTSYSGRTDLSFMEEKYPLDIADNDAIFYSEDVMFYEDDITTSSEGISINGRIVLMPLVVRDASFNAVGMIDDTAMTDSDMMNSEQMVEESLEQEDTEQNGLSSMTVAALWVAVSAAGAAVVAAGASGLMNGASGSVSTTNSEMASTKEDVVSEDENTGTTDLADSLMDWLKEKGSGYELVINEGIDLPEMLCKEGNVIEIPVRVDGGENGNWMFIAACICGKENKKLIKTTVIPYGGGRGMITIALKGDEVAKKETVYCTITALDADTMQVRDLDTFDFELITEAEKDKQE